MNCNNSKSLNHHNLNLIQNDSQKDHLHSNLSLFSKDLSHLVNIRCLNFLSRKVVVLSELLLNNRSHSQFLTSFNIKKLTAKNFPCVQYQRPSSVLNLPTDVFVSHIVQYLSMKDRISLLRVNKACFQLNKESLVMEIFWVQHNVFKLPCYSQKQETGRQYKIFLHKWLSILEAGPAVKKVNLSWLKFLERQDIKKLCLACVNIEELNLSGWGISDTELILIAKAYPKLKGIVLDSVNYISNVGVKFQLQNCPHLDFLSLGYNHDQTKYGYGLRDGIFDKTCPEYPNLRYLYLSNSQASDQELKFVAKKCKNLQRLDLRCSRSLTDNGLKSLSENCFQLEELNLSECIQITDKGLGFIFKGCPKLKKLDIGGTSHVKSESLRDLSQYGLDLRCLILDHKINLSNDLLKNICENSPNLEVLSIVQFNHVTDDVLTHALSKCPKLKQIYLTGCHQITLEMLDNYKKSYPSLLFKLNRNACGAIETGTWPIKRIG